MLEQRFEELQKALTRAGDKLELAAEVVQRRSMALVASTLALALALLASIAAVAFVQFNNERRIHESEARWCPVLQLLVPGPGDAPPTTERGKQIAREATLLSLSFGCEAPNRREGSDS